MQGGTLLDRRDEIGEHEGKPSDFAVFVESDAGERLWPPSVSGFRASAVGKAGHMVIALPIKIRYRPPGGSFLRGERGFGFDLSGCCDEVKPGLVGDDYGQ